MPDAAGLPRGTVLAFDFGERRIGVAVGEWQLLQAHALTTIHGDGNNQRFSAIAALIDEWRPASLVVGQPTSLDGTAHAMTARCQRFANQLRGRFGLLVEYAEERLSSYEAQDRLLAAGHNTRSARGYLDAVAAQLILQSHFDRAGSQDSRPYHP
ncbi:Holliday junction resolvase [Candidatus Accumulibacter aalborgensis]|uniref:Putative pre-16S rRNA nuclease n=1 Tax=Candidatus Accumulibacter aalborgensis TaxID=1860102 RepID=A0A1A8XM74_9PROT|nr:Holliday junction resolvase RuvX [Candidatus Accumulibacter aalborgensis]SBT05771.1 Holliday junction resolvase [Candidatus Accumulibacter aalborgensis]